MPNEMPNEMPAGETQRLRLPVQAAPVNRTVVASALSGEGGVNASVWFGGYPLPFPAMMMMIVMM